MIHSLSLTVEKDKGVIKSHRPFWRKMRLISKIALQTHSKSADVMYDIVDCYDHCECWWRHQATRNWKALGKERLNPSPCSRFYRSRCKYPAQRMCIIPTIIFRPVMHAKFIPSCYTREVFIITTTITSNHIYIYIYAYIVHPLWRQRQNFRSAPAIGTY